MVAWGTFAEEHFVLTEGALAEFASSPGVRRGYCSDCGTTITYRHELRPGEVDLTLATLDDPGSLRPNAHIWVRDKLPWVQISDGLPQYDTVRDDA